MAEKAERVKLPDQLPRLRYVFFMLKVSALTVTDASSSTKRNQPPPPKPKPKRKLRLRVHRPHCVFEFLERTHLP
jgi:hypothetical protein